MNKTDWRRKLTSRKFWLAVAGFVSALIVAFGKDSTEAQTIAGLIMSGAAVIGYIIGEGLADGATTVINYPTTGEDEENTEDTDGEMIPG